MDKKMLAAIGAASTVALMAGAGGAAAQVMTLMDPQSYAELLQPIPNAAEILKVVDDMQTKAPIERVQWGHHHHHSHHHNWHHHHHGWHHHHHHGWFHHHHHHHHGAGFYFNPFV